MSGENELGKFCNLQNTKIGDNKFIIQVTLC